MILISHKIKYIFGISACTPSRTTTRTHVIVFVVRSSYFFRRTCRHGAVWLLLGLAGELISWMKLRGPPKGINHRFLVIRTRQHYVIAPHLF